MFDLLRISSSSIALGILFSVSLFPSFFQDDRSTLPVTLLLPAYPLQGSPPSGVFCLLYDPPVARGTPQTFNVQSFPLHAVLRYRLTSVKQVMHRCTLLLLWDTLRPPSTI